MSCPVVYGTWVKKAFKGWELWAGPREDTWAAWMYITYSSIHRGLCSKNLVSCVVASEVSADHRGTNACNPPMRGHIFSKPFKAKSQTSELLRTAAVDTEMSTFQERTVYPELHFYRCSVSRVGCRHVFPEVLGEVNQGALCWLSSSGQHFLNLIRSLWWRSLRRSFVLPEINEIVLRFL